MSIQEFQVSSASMLEALAETLDVSPSKYEEAKAHYEAVGNWLNRPGSSLAEYNPTIYAQGSFALGTAVRPLGDEEYDVDAVCLLQSTPSRHTQEEIKKLVGDCLKENEDYKRMLGPEGRRCWTLNYAKGSKFHLDILPAIPDPDWPYLLAESIPLQIAKEAICITDRETWDYEDDWPKSNPKGYLEWFKEQMKVVFSEQRQVLAKAVRAEVHEIPEYKIRTPLQRVIQILKRHRDIMFEGDDHKPISIIITTLAAHAYNNEADILDALRNIVSRMGGLVEHRTGGYWVPNPVSPKENFADRWKNEPEKAEAFFEWIAAVERLVQGVETLGGLEEFENYLRPHFGSREVNQAIAKIKESPAILKQGYATPPAKPGLGRAALDSVIFISRNLINGVGIPWKKPLMWPVLEQSTVSIQATCKRGNQAPKPFSSDPTPLPKHCSLRFTAKTRIQPPFAVFWQVVNTGDEALQVGGGRGEIFEGDLQHFESTLYRGSHSIECFIIKDAVCVARSGPFIVNIS